MVLEQTPPKVKMLEIFFLGRGATELTGSFIFRSQIARANLGNLKTLKVPWEKYVIPADWLQRRKTSAILPNMSRLVPIHAWEGAFPSEWAGCCRILPSRSSWTPRGFSLLCCLDAPYAPSVNKQDKSQQTRQDSLSSIGTEQSFSITGNQGKRIQPSLCLRITILGHPIDVAVQCKKTPVHPQNSSWACLALKSMDVATTANAIWAWIYEK